LTPSGHRQSIAACETFLICGADGKQSLSRHDVGDRYSITLIGGCEQRWGHINAKQSGGLQVDDELERDRLHDRQGLVASGFS
jgi:hypothetical protein